MAQKSQRSKRAVIVVASLEAQGARVRETGKKGWVVYLPDEAKTIITIHNSESDPRAEQNTRARVKRAGFRWPFDAQ